jgi:hypothetical protein
MRVPVLFMPAVIAAEQVGAGREELEDFDEAAEPGSYRGCVSPR